MFGLFKKDWNTATINAVNELIPKINMLSMSASIIRVNINSVREEIGGNLIDECKIALNSFELGAAIHSLSQFYHLEKLNHPMKFHLLLCSIFYEDLKDKKISCEAEWQKRAMIYTDALADRYKIFRELGYSFNEELTQISPSNQISKLQLFKQILKQLDQQTHLLTKDGLITKR